MSLYVTCLTLNKTGRQHKQKIINKSLQSSGMERHIVWDIITCTLQEPAASNYGSVKFRKDHNLTMHCHDKPHTSQRIK